MSEIILQPAMKALITYKGKILLLREAQTEESTQVGKFQFPGGRVDPGEHFLDGLRREIMEETGLEVTVKRPIHVDEWRPIIRGVQHQIIATFFHVEALSDTVSLSDEHDEFIWITPDEVQSYELAGSESELIKIYLELPT